MARRGAWLLAVLLASLAVGCAPAPATPSAKPAAPTPAAAGSAARPPSEQPAASASTGAGTTASTAAAPAPLQTVRADTIGVGAEVPMYLAMEHGYFRDVGIELELVPLSGSTDNVAMLSSDQLEVSAIPIAPAIFNAMARGVGIRMVGDRGSSIPGRTTVNLSLRTDLLERRPWSGYGDLRGLKIAVQQPGSMTEYYLLQMLQRGGLQRSDVEIVSPFPYADMAAAFSNRAIDAAIYNEPFATQQEQQGIIKKVLYVSDVAPGMTTAAIVYSERFANNTDLARNYMVGWLRGVRHYWDAYDGRRDFQDVIDVLRKYTRLTDESLLRKLPQTGQNPAGYLNPADLVTVQDWFAENGQVPQKVDIARAYDRGFADYANGVLGAYQPVESPRRPE